MSMTRAQVLFASSFVGALALGSSVAQAKLPPQGISGGASSANIMIMLDVSGSMTNLRADGAAATSPLGGLSGNSRIERVEFDAAGQLWKIELNNPVRPTGLIQVSANGAPVRQPIVYGNHTPMFLKRHGSRMLVLYMDATLTTRRHLVQYDQAGNIVAAAMSSDYRETMQVICASDTQIFIVDTNRYVQYSSNGLALQRISTLPSRPRSQLTGCADVGLGSFHFVLSDRDGYIYNFQGLTSFTHRGLFRQRFVNEDFPRSLRRYVAVDSSNRVVAVDAGQSVRDTYAPTAPVNPVSSIARSPSDNGLAIAGFSGGRGQVATLPIRTSSVTYFLPQQFQLPLITIAKNVIQDVVKDSEFNKRATFGLLTWGASARVVVPFGISSNDTLLRVVPGLTARESSTRLGNAMSVASNYIKSSSFSSSTSGCSKTILIVISDGYWFDSSLAESMARDLLNQTKVETHVIGLGPAVTQGGVSYTNLAVAGGSSPTSPMFARDMTALKTSLKEALYVALASTFSAVAPTVLPSSQIGNIVIQPTFEYAANGQWKGFLNAYELDQNLNLSGSVRWRFHERLNAMQPNARRIWTVSDRLPPPLSANLNNFTSANAGVLRNEIFGTNSVAVSSVATQELIDFIRGRDVFDDDKDGNKLEDRWKLQDIYHSRPIFLARPKPNLQGGDEYVGAEQFFEARHRGSYQRFYDRWKNRREVVLAGSNSGLLHAIDADTGQELWAFLPPPMKRKVSELSGVNSSGRTGNSISMYGLDGSLVARDIYTGGEWRTILAISYGLGARALTLMDVTDPDRPRHLFSVENRYENGAYSLYRWDEDGELTMSSSTETGNYPYRSLGYTTSSPVMTFLRDSEDEYNPVVIMGAGSATAIDSGTGSAVYVIDLSLETVGRAQRIAARRSLGAQPVNDLATDIEVIESGSSSRMKGRYGAEVFLPNSNGVLDTVDLSGSSTAATDIKKDVPLRMVFDGQATVSNDRIVGFPISISNNTLSSVYSDPLNIILGTGDMDRLAIAPSSPPDNFIASIQGSESVLFTNNANLTLPSLFPADSIQRSQCPAPSTPSRGWRLSMNNLSGPDARGNATSMRHGKLSSKILQYGGSALFTVYAPAQSNACSLGNSCYVERDAACGFSKNIRCFKGQMLGGVTVYRDKVFVSVSGGAGQESMPGGFMRQDNLITGTGTFTPSQSGSVNYYGRQILR